MSGKPLTFGILYAPVQLLDIAGPMDIVGLCSRSSMAIVRKFLPNIDEEKYQGMVEKSLDMTIHHIGPTMSPVNLSCNFHVQPTCTIDDCPPLDYLLCGGPGPQYFMPGGDMPESMKQFIRNRTKECKSVFATCTGALVLAAAGVLDGHRATVNHTVVPMGKEAYPAVKWEDGKNWVIDGKFWTSSGAVSGADMVGQWAREQCGDDVMDAVTALLEWQPRDIDGHPMAYVNGRGEKVSV